jgi:hypothetical protein
MVVIVDDNSGSMRGPRQQNCVRKTIQIIDYCRLNSIPYQYATFGNNDIQRGSCRSDEVEGILRCDDGTKLMKLAEASINGARLLLNKIQFNSSFRIIFVMNTDGEANDGDRAVEFFHSSFLELEKKYPKMVKPRTFVMGIGGQHDQNVLGAISVGESSYFNYPDDDLPRMVVDTTQRILPELLTSVKIDMELSGGTVLSLRPDDETNMVCLDGTRVSEEDVSLTLNTNGEIICFLREDVNQDHPKYFDFMLKKIKEDAMKLVEDIHRSSKYSIAVLSEKLEELRHELSELVDPRSIVVEIEDDLTMICNSRETNPNWQKDFNRCISKIRTRKHLKGEIIDRKTATLSVLKLCVDGIRSLKIGNSLSTELQRDFLELLGSGGFEHWTNKTKSKVVVRALEQVDPDSVSSADARVLDLLKTMPEFTDTSQEPRCWLTLKTESEMCAEGDVLCLVGYIPKKARNLLMCPVSSSKVLERAVVNNEMIICPQLMSLLTIRTLLLEGKEIARGPHGFPINAVLCLIPFDTKISIKLAKVYSPIACSQLITSRWIYTNKTSEYKNGVLSSLLSITHSENEFSFITLINSMDSLYRQNFGLKFLKDVLQRGMAFVNNGATTSGEVSTFSVAIADQMMLLSHNRLRDNMIAMMSGDEFKEENDVSSIPEWKSENSITFWRNLFLRILRDRMDILFSAFCRPNDPNGDEKRKQNEIDVQDFLAILTIGLNDPELSKDGKISENIFCKKNKPKDVLHHHEDDGTGFLLDDFHEEPELDKLDQNGNQEASLLNVSKCISLKEVTIEQMDLKDLKAHLLSLKRDLKPPELIIAPEDTLLGNTNDRTRTSIVNSLLSNIKFEIDFVLSCANHMHYQKTSPEHMTPITSLLELLDIKNDREGFEWIVGQVYLAVELRDNKKYRSETSILRIHFHEMLLNNAIKIKSKAIKDDEILKKACNDKRRKEYVIMFKSHHAKFLDDRSNAELSRPKLTVVEFINIHKITEEDEKKLVEEAFLICSNNKSIVHTEQFICDMTLTKSQRHEAKRKRRYLRLNPNSNI